MAQPRTLSMPLAPEMVNPDGPPPAACMPVAAGEEVRVPCKIGLRARVEELHLEVGKLAAQVDCVACLRSICNAPCSRRGPRYGDWCGCGGADKPTTRRI